MTLPGCSCPARGDGFARAPLDRAYPLGALRVRVSAPRYSLPRPTSKGVTGVLADPGGGGERAPSRPRPVSHCFSYPAARAIRPLCLITGTVSTFRSGPRLYSGPVGVWQTHGGRRPAVRPAPRRPRLRRRRPCPARRRPGRLQSRLRRSPRWRRPHTPAWPVRPAVLGNGRFPGLTFRHFLRSMEGYLPERGRRLERSGDEGSHCH